MLRIFVADQYFCKERTLAAGIEDALRVKDRAQARNSRLCRPCLCKIDTCHSSDKQIRRRPIQAFADAV
jgi:hypothetical protein